MIKAVWDQTGTPQNPVNWSDPDTWINERLTGDLQTLARKIWEGSKKTLNPRYLYDSYLFINRLNLLDQDEGVYRLGERGRKFLANDHAILRELDAVEGLPKLLSLVAERSPCKRSDILPGMVRLSQGCVAVQNVQHLHRHIMASVKQSCPTRLSDARGQLLRRHGRRPSMAEGLRQFCRGDGRRAIVKAHHRRRSRARPQRRAIEGVQGATDETRTRAISSISSKRFWTRWTTKTFASRN